MISTSKLKIISKFDTGLWIIIIMAFIVGVAGGLFSVLFRLMIGWANSGYHGLGESIFSFLPGEWWKIAVPALAGFVVGPLVYFLAREAKGHGVPEVMVSHARR